MKKALQQGEYVIGDLGCNDERCFQHGDPCVQASLHENYEQGTKQ